MGLVRISLDSWELTDAERGICGDLKRVMQDRPTPPKECARPVVRTRNGNLVVARAR